MLVQDFDFTLPEELIAQHAAPRGESRLMALNRANGAIQHRTIADFPSMLTPGDLLVVNNTRVFAARLLGHRVPSGGAVECLLLGRAAAAGCAAGLDSAAADPAAPLYDALMHPGQKLKPGSRVRFDGAAGALI